MEIDFCHFKDVNEQNTNLTFWAALYIILLVHLLYSSSVSLLTRDQSKYRIIPNSDYGRTCDISSAAEKTKKIATNKVSAATAT